ncbi:MAG: ribonuclease H family protein [Clostridiales bacterium]|nr:ribonuclease H family protein [Clostridiales bacterium]
MSSKFYAVKKGRKIGIFTSWEDCKDSVHGYTNAIYKSFTNMNDAKKYLYGNENESGSSDSKAELSAYIDGSYDDNLKRYSYATIIFHKGKKMEYSKGESNKDLVELRNVAGELKAAMYVMEYALNNKIKSIDLFYDYSGIEMWATGEWKANLPFTKHYSEFSNKVLKAIDVRFIKIKSHSGNKYNEEVDALAKKAIYQNETNNIVNVHNFDNEMREYDKLYDSILEELKKTKSSLDLGMYIIGNRIISSKDVYNKFKVLWKNKKRLLSQIEGLKSFFDIDNLSFVIVVYTENEKVQFIIRGDEING